MIPLNKTRCRPNQMCPGAGSGPWLPVGTRPKPSHVSLTTCVCVCGFAVLEKSEFKDESQYFRFHADEEMEGTSSKNKQLRNDFKLVENILAKRLLVGAELSCRVFLPRPIGFRCGWKTFRCGLSLEHPRVWVFLGGGWQRCQEARSLHWPRLPSSQKRSGCLAFPFHLPLSSLHPSLAFAERMAS